jgi:hypothetical protein
MAGHRTNESNLGLKLSRIVEKWLILGGIFFRRDAGFWGKNKE